MKIDDYSHLLNQNIQSLRGRLQGAANTTQLLDSLGLQEKQTARDVLLPALGLFGAGVAAGAVLGLIFAPKPGRETRQVIVETVELARHRPVQPPSEPEEDSNPYID